MTARHVLARIGKRLVKSRRPRDPWTSYAVWLRDRAVARRSDGRPAAEITVSIITAVHDPPPAILTQTIQSVKAQTFQHWEWIVVDNASQRPDVLDALNGAAQDGRVHLLRSDSNLGIIGGMKAALDASTGDFVVPLDHDDVLVEDAVEVVAKTIASAPGARFIYSDEDVLVENQPRHPYLRSDWDPVLNLCTSYIFHLCAFGRADAVRLGVFTDGEAEYVQDWDTLFRFVLDGCDPLHVPEVLYHWRAHEQSATNQSRPATDSLCSQRHVLQRFLYRHPRGKLFEVTRWPVDRGTPEPWLRRLPVSPASVDLVVYGADGVEAARVAEAAAYPFASVHCGGADLRDALTHVLPDCRGDLVACVSGDVVPRGADWPWEAQGLIDLHPETAIVSGRILNEARNVVGGGEVMSASHLPICPALGRPELDAGPWGLALKQRSADACHHAFFVAARPFLEQFVESAPAEARGDALGAWLGLAAAREKKRVAFSPLVTAVARTIFTGEMKLDAASRSAYIRWGAGAIPPERWYRTELTAFVQ
jgi:Glycosyl transferase family 2